MGCGQSQSPPSDALAEPTVNVPAQATSQDVTRTAESTSVDSSAASVETTKENAATSKIEGAVVATVLLPDGGPGILQPHAYNPGRGRVVDPSVDTEAVPEHMFYVFDRWPVLRPGLKEFLVALRNRRAKGELKSILLYTANSKIEWVKFIMKAMLLYFELPNDTFDGIRHAPGGLKLVPPKEVLFDDHPENADGNCVAVDPYFNDVPWDVLEPLFSYLPDDGKGGLAAFIADDKAHEDKPHDKESEETLLEFAKDPCTGCAEFEDVPDVVLLDLDETLIQGARTSAYFAAINHFIKFRKVE